MRVKIKEKSNIPQLRFGKTYEIILATCTWSYRFKFIRKNYVYVTEVNQSTVIDRPIKMTKRDLKRLIMSKEFTERVVKIEE
ncbi:hypothetical protein ACFWMS_25275 [Peribacillus butanolivorans]|uniref:hypothetical protein n=1 Tax=Peribacillus butanolivorans TaxID=421767 RepID=UPI0036593427